MITDVPGVLAGHWTDQAAMTGCTVVIFPEGTVASGEVRGGAPGTREFELLRPERSVTRIDAAVLTGGSAFGLAACDGVMRWCEERGRGFPTPSGVVPIVVGAVVYDLGVGDPTVRPDADAGYAACEAAVEGHCATGAVGAGTGCRTATWRGAERSRQGGLGTATARQSRLVVSSLVAVNAWGEAAPATDLHPLEAGTAGGGLQSTTIGVVTTNARLDKLGCLLVAQSAHDGLARALEPAHACVDGDAFVAAATGDLELPLDAVRVLAARCVEGAIRSVVGRDERSEAEAGEG